MTAPRQKNWGIDVAPLTGFIFYLCRQGAQCVQRLDLPLGQPLIAEWRRLRSGTFAGK